MLTSDLVFSSSTVFLGLEVSWRRNHPRSLRVSSRRHTTLGNETHNMLMHPHRPYGSSYVFFTVRASEITSNCSSWTHPSDSSSQPCSSYSCTPCTATPRSPTTHYQSGPCPSHSNTFPRPVCLQESKEDQTEGFERHAACSGAGGRGCEARQG